MTLAEIALTPPGRAFKRPIYGFPYIIMPLSHALIELDHLGRSQLPRLSSEDLIATDWELLD